MTTFRIFDRNDAFLYTRADASSFQHFCEDFSFEATFPRNTEHPLDAGMRIAWKDDDDQWEIHEIVTAELDAHGRNLELTGVHLALAELRDIRIASLQLENSSLLNAVNTVLSGTGWARGTLPAEEEARVSEVRSEVWRVNTRQSRLNLRAGTGTNYKSIGLYKKGTLVSLIEKTNGSWYKVETPDGRIGWMSTDYLVYDHTIITPRPSEPGTYAITISDTWLTAWEALEAIADAARLLLMPRVSVADDGTFSRSVDLVTTEPTYRGVRLTCDTNVRSASVRYDTSQLYTALIGVGKNDTTFTSKVWKKSSGDPVDKPAGQDYVAIPEALDLYGRNGRHRIGLARFTDIEDPGTLLQKTYDELLVASVPAVEIDATIADLYQLGYGGQSMRLYDEIQIILNPIGIRLSARIVGLTRDLVLPERTRPIIGTALESDIVNEVLSANTSATHISEWQIKSVSTISIGSGSVKTENLANGCVTNQKLASGAVGYSNLTNSAVTSVGDAVGARLSALASGTSGDDIYAGLAHAVALAAQGATGDPLAVALRAAVQAFK